MTSISDDFDYLINLTKEVPLNGDIPEVHIENLCKKIKKAFFKNDPSAFIRFFEPLKDNFSAFKRAKIFRKESAVEKAMREIILQLDSMNGIYELLKISALYDTKKFIKLFITTEGKAFSPDHLMKLLLLLAKERPGAFLQVIRFVELSPSQAKQLYESIKKDAP
jgi:hypothetical protein